MQAVDTYIAAILPKKPLICRLRLRGPQRVVESMGRLKRSN